MTKQEQVQDAIARITNGEIIDVIDASWSSTGVCIGDFRDIGWSERVATYDSLYYRWKGPSAIRVGSKLVNPGGHTEESDMDWT